MWKKKPLTILTTLREHRTSFVYLFVWLFSTCGPADTRVEVETSKNENNGGDSSLRKFESSYRCHLPQTPFFIVTIISSQIDKGLVELSVRARMSEQELWACITLCIGCYLQQAKLRSAD